LRLDDAMADVFPAIARDGAQLFSVQMRLQKALLALTLISPQTFGRAALHQSAAALLRCTDQMQADEQAALQAIAGQITAASGLHPPTSNQPDRPLDLRQSGIF